MSDTESFESVVNESFEIAKAKLRITFEGKLFERLLSDLQAAHDREIAQARDPQRLRGTKPDTFDGAIEALREFRWQHATNDEDAIPYINVVKEMHDREIRDVSQREFARGMDAGKHSMDAEHRAIAMRLRGLRFDGGSHENLSRIAYAIYPCATGWTCESADGLRDKLIDLLGGVSDDTCGAGCCCAAADCDGDCGLQREEVSDSEYSVNDSPSSNRSGGTNRDDSRSRGCRDRHHTPPKELEVSDGRVADDSGADTGCGDGGGGVHMAGVSTYDVLWNERRKAIAELRKMTIDSDYYGNYQRIALAIGTVYDGKSFASECVRDRLIHLLGGDQPSGIDVLRAMDPESDTDGTCPNDVPTSSITDELRRWASTEVPYNYGHQLQAIADRIDEQFDRICEQQEAVLQETIDGMVKEYEHDRLSDQLRIEKLERQRDAAHSCADELSDELLRVRRERDELRAKLEIIREAVDE